MTAAATMDVDNDDASNFESKLIDYLTNNSNAQFKSQQRDEQDITIENKKEIATKIYKESKTKFLSRFGKYINPAHLDHFKQFSNDGKDGYEIKYYLKELTRYHDKDLRKKDVRNRRFQAMQQLRTGSTYFSEVEMMRRNPLLYEQLVGQYLTEEERKTRDKLNPEECSFANILLEGYQREQVQELKNRQEDEMESDSEEEYIADPTEEELEDERLNKFDMNPGPSKGRWGEFNSVEDRRQDDVANSIKTVKRDENWFKVSCKERDLLRQEFQSHMYDSFLNGQDTDFDYSEIDFNDSYDNIDVLSRDNEEKYFDSESPEEVQLEEESMVKEDSSEDELDVFMRHLSNQPTVQELTNSIKNM